MPIGRIEREQKTEMEKFKRNSNLDLFKTISIFSVIIIHSNLFANQSTNEPTIVTAVINQVCRFAVPYFFIVSGYFWENKLSQKNYSLTDFLLKLKPLSLAFLLWSGIYLVLTFNLQQLFQYGYLKVTYWKCYAALQSPVKTLFSGTQSQLWFLPALICSQIFVFALYQYRKFLILPVSFALFILGVLGGAYQDTYIGIHLPFDTRNGICFASIFLVMGILLKQFQFQISTAKALLLFTIGLIGQLAEVGYLWGDFDVHPTDVDFVFSTLPFGLGVMFLALSPITFPLQYLGKIGQHTLGIYLIHMIFIDLMRPLSQIMHPWLYALLIPLTIYIGSLLLIVQLKKYKNILLYG